MGNLDKFSFKITIVILRFLDNNEQETIEDILHDQNDINESTRLQLENLTMALAELQGGAQTEAEAKNRVYSGRRRQKQ